MKCRWQHNFFEVYIIIVKLNFLMYVVNFITILWRKVSKYDINYKIFININYTTEKLYKTTT